MENHETKNESRCLPLKSNDLLDRLTSGLREADNESAALAIAEVLAQKKHVCLNCKSCKTINTDDFAARVAYNIALIDAAEIISRYYLEAV